jgi:hypothetical protein
MVRRMAVALRPLTRFSSLGSLSGNDRSCAPASCQTRWWRGLSRDCQPSRGSSLVPTRLFESPCGAGLLIPLGDVVPLPERRHPLRAAWLLAGARRVWPSGPHQATRASMTLRGCPLASVLSDDSRVDFPARDTLRRPKPIHQSSHLAFCVPPSVLIELR